MIKKVYIWQVQKKNTLQKERRKKNQKKKENTQKKQYVKKLSSAKLMGAKVWYEIDILSHQISFLQILCISFNMGKH